MIGGWSAQLVETLTGQAASQPIRILGGTWTDGPLNDVSASSVHLPTRDLLDYPDWWREPWSGSVLVCYDTHPLQLGPILNQPTGDLSKMIIQFGGLLSLLQHRHVTDRDYPSGHGPALAESALAYDGPSYGSIMVDLVKRAQMRPNGWFPIRYASPQENTARIRNYKGVDVPNAQTAKRIQELAGVIAGPDFRFTPEWVQPGSSVRWVMEHGTHGMPQLAQDHVFSLDLTALRTRLSEPVASAESSQYCRAYMFGAGEGETTHVQIVDRQPPEHMPFLEVARTDSQVEESSADLLTLRGESLIRDFKVVQFTANMVANDPVKPIWRWKVGDEFIVRVPEGMPHVDAGVWRCRTIARTGSYDTDSYKIELQPEERVSS